MSGDAASGDSLVGPAAASPPKTNPNPHTKEKFHEAIHHRARDRRPCDLSADQLAEIARTSNDAAASLGVPYSWVTSYVAGDKVFCVHEADDEETVREHSRRGGFPANVVTEVAAEFGPQTAGAVSEVIR